MSVTPMNDYAAPPAEQVAEEYARHVSHSGPLDWLLEQRVPADALDGVARLRSGLRLTPEGPRFVVDPPAGNDIVAERLAFHLPVYRDGVLVDLIRFSEDYGGRDFKARGGRVCRAVDWLGEPEPEGVDARGWPLPTRVWRSPLGWLRAGRRGLVFLRTSWRYDRLTLLRSLPAVMGEDTEHSETLDVRVWDGDRTKRPARWSRIDPADGDGLARLGMVRAVARELTRG